MEQELQITKAVYQSAKGTPVTDSLRVADIFGKKHQHVMESIRKLLSVENSTDQNKWFYKSTYVDSQNKTQPLYVMNRDGFTLLAMGMTGTKAMQFKVAYIEQFNRMGEQIKQAQPTTQRLPTTFAEALRLAAEQAEQIELQQRQIEQNKPRVLFSEAVETSNDSVLIGELAKILCQNGINTGEKRLFAWMRDNGYLCSFGNRYNQPTQQAMEMHLFEIKKQSITKPNGDVIVASTTKVTGKGQIYFVNRFLKQQNATGK